MFGKAKAELYFLAIESERESSLRLGRRGREGMIRCREGQIRSRSTICTGFDLPFQAMGNIGDPSVLVITSTYPLPRIPCARK